MVARGALPSQAAGYRLALFQRVCRFIPRHARNCSFGDIAIAAVPAPWWQGVRKKRRHTEW
jgi:hypothetical protein